MSTSDFNKVLIKDDLIANLTDSINYAVVQGGQNITSARYPCPALSSSSQVFSIQVPSENTIIDREVMWHSKVEFTMKGTPANAAYLVDYGGSEAFAPFPMNQMISTMSATINNNTMSMSVQDILPSILRLHDKRQLSRYNGLTPTQFDMYKNYSDAATSMNNPLGDFSNVADNDLYPRGAFRIISINGNTAGDGNPKEVKIVVEFTEPLMLSPFLFANPESNNQGMYGIQTLGFNFNFDSQCKRVFRSTRDKITSVSANFQSSELIFKYVSPHASDLLPARNVLPFYQLEKYLTPNLAPITAGASATLTSATLQLNSIPDRLIISARKRMTSQTFNDTDSFLVIKSIKVDFNNSSGLCSSFTPQDLFKCSVRNGSNQSWSEFSGYGNKKTNDGSNGQIPLSGSLVILEFGLDVELHENYLSQGSLGSYQLRIVVDVENQDGVAVDAELCVVTMNSGLMTLERGSCSTYVGVLTKSDVLETAGMEPYSRSDVTRLVGGGATSDKVTKIAKLVAPLAKAALASSDNKYAQLASKGIGALGYGMSAGNHGIEKRIKK